jgi:hypothetical protein
MSSLTQDERKVYVDSLNSFMIEDLDKAIKEGFNYLAAPVLSNYTEILGGQIVVRCRSDDGQIVVR